MTRKSWWLALGVAVFLGCDSVSNPEPNNTIPPSPPDMKHVPAKTGPGAPQTKAPTDYPGLNSNQAEQGKPENATPAPKADESKPETPKGDQPKAEEPKGEAKAETVNLSDEEIAQIKKLPEAEQALALKQKVCPISDEHLGEMGKPYKVSAGGETFFLCCSGCEKELKNEATLKTALAKLKTSK